MCLFYRTSTLSHVAFIIICLGFVLVGVSTTLTMTYSFGVTKSTETHLTEQLISNDSFPDDAVCLVFPFSSHSVLSPFVFKMQPPKSRYKTKSTFH